MISAKANSYPFALYVQEYEQPNEGVVQLTAGQNLTGVVDREQCFDLERGSWNKDTPIFENGACLVVSQ